MLCDEPAPRECGGEDGGIRGKAHIGVKRDDETEPRASAIYRGDNGLRH